jgi:hypothetical protein
MLILWLRRLDSGTGGLATPYLPLLRIRSDEGQSPNVGVSLS